MGYDNQNQQSDTKILGYDCKIRIAKKYINCVKRIPLDTPAGFQLSTQLPNIMSHPKMVLPWWTYWDLCGIFMRYWWDMNGSNRNEKWSINYQRDIPGVFFRYWRNILLNINEILIRFEWNSGHYLPEISCIICCRIPAFFGRWYPHLFMSWFLP